MFTLLTFLFVKSEYNEEKGQTEGGHICDIAFF